MQYGLEREKGRWVEDVITCLSWVGLQRDYRTGMVKVGPADFAAPACRRNTDAIALGHTAHAQRPIQERLQNGTYAICRA